MKTAPVVHTAHGVEQVGDVHDSGLHALNHLFISGVGVACLKDDAFGYAVQRQFAHMFEFGSNGHVDDFSLGGFPEFVHQLQINRA